MLFELKHNKGIDKWEMATGTPACLSLSFTCSEYIFCQKEKKIPLGPG